MKRKIVKKILALSVIGAMVMGIMACGNSSSGNSDGTQQSADNTNQESSDVGGQMQEKKVQSQVRRKCTGFPM